MSASKTEVLGLVALLLGVVLVVVCVFLLAGLAWASGALGAFLVLGGVLLVRLAALMSKEGDA